MKTKALLKITKLLSPRLNFSNISDKKLIKLIKMTTFYDEVKSSYIAPFSTELKSNLQIQTSTESKSMIVESTLDEIREYIRCFSDDMELLKKDHNYYKKYYNPLKAQEHANNQIKEASFDDLPRQHLKNLYTIQTHNVLIELLEILGKLCFKYKIKYSEIIREMYIGRPVPLLIEMSEVVYYATEFQEKKMKEQLQEEPKPVSDDNKRPDFGNINLENIWLRTKEEYDWIIDNLSKQKIVHQEVTVNKCGHDKQEIIEIPLIILELGQDGEKPSWNAPGHYLKAFLQILISLGLIKTEFIKNDKTTSIKDKDYRQIINNTFETKRWKDGGNVSIYRTLIPKRDQKNNEKKSKYPMPYHYEAFKEIQKKFKKK
jgi:hypothetical protein